MSLALRARHVVPVGQPPLRDGVVRIAGPWIESVAAYSPGDSVIDLGDVAILPGLVNAHTHLEFSDLVTPLGHRGIPLPEWIRHVIAYRNGIGRFAGASVRLGLAESAARGVTTVGEIAQPAWHMGPLDDSGLDVTVFLELIGLSSARIKELVELARQHVHAPLRPATAIGGVTLSKGSDPAARVRTWRTGLSPHAPYSTHSDLLHNATSLAREQGRSAARTAESSSAAADSVSGAGVVAMHVAESREELELLRAGTGPFRDLLQELGVSLARMFRNRRKPLDILKALSLAPRALVVHGNYLDADELNYLAARRETMSLAYCPRTHEWFGHEPYPMSAILRRGLNLALGTDSRASNPDLNLLSEMRTVVRQFPGVFPAEVLRMGTINGAAALGRQRLTGTIEPGKLAHLTAIAVDPAAADPLEAVLHGDGQATGTWCYGRRVGGVNG